VAAYRFVAPFVDLLDVNATVRPRMVRAALCHRVDGRTVQCSFSAHIRTNGKTMHSIVRVHRQRDGLLGFLLMHWQFWRYAAGSGVVGDGQLPAELGDVASSEPGGQQASEGIDASGGGSVD
jgi:hypothetical protein